MKVRDFSKLYFGLLVLHLAVIYKPESQALYILSKPALLFSLLTFFVHRTKAVITPSKYWIVLALLASWVGDILVMNTGEFFLRSGLMLFALAHLAYAGFYFRQSEKSRWLIQLTAAVIPAIAIYILLQWIPVPQSLMPYLLGYALLPGLHFVKSTGFADLHSGILRLPALGALLFMISDLLLAYKEFYTGEKYAQIAVMATYAIAQYLIVIGLLPWFEESKESSGTNTHIGSTS